MYLEGTTAWCEDCGREVEVWRVHWLKLETLATVLGWILRAFCAGCALVTGLYLLKMGVYGVIRGDLLVEATAFYERLLSGGKFELAACLGLSYSVGYIFNAGRWMNFLGGHRALRFRRRLVNRLFGLRGRYWRFSGERLICARCGSERLRPQSVNTLDFPELGEDFYQNLRSVDIELLRRNGVDLQNLVAWRQDQEIKPIIAEDPPTVIIRPFRRKPSGLSQLTEQNAEEKPQESSEKDGSEKSGDEWDDLIDLDGEI